MRINYVLPFSGLTGGIRVAFEIASGLRRRGHDVSLTLPAQSQGFFEFDGRILYPRKSGIEMILRFGMQRLLSSEELNEIDLIRLERSIPECDVNVATFCMTAYPVYRSGRGSAFFHMQHYEPLFFDNLRTKRVAEETYYLPMKKIANSSWLQQLIKKNIGLESTLICPAIDHETFHPRKEVEDHSRRRVVAFAKQVDWKGTPDLLDAMKLVFAARKDVDLILYGSSRVSHTKEGVPYRFLLKPSDEELAELYSTADVVVCPSWYESFPLPPIEAMGCGAPVVTTRIGTEDCAFHEDNCLVVPAKDPKAMANAIARILSDESLTERFRKTGPATAKKFTWDKTVDDVERTFREAIR